VFAILLKRMEEHIDQAVVPKQTLPVQKLEIADVVQKAGSRRELYIKLLNNAFSADAFLVSA
jgi:hypothetical protein